ncbi:MAG: C-GCAxxG-C-C family protein [Phocaeicola sp.]
MENQERKDLAVALFKEGYNCSQAVVAAFAGEYGFTREQALRMSASFGGGIGRMRETCGAACAIFLLAGLEKGATCGKDQQGKKENYELVQQLANEFKRRNGALRCADLLKEPTSKAIQSTPEERNKSYYAKRPCVKLVEDAADIWCNYIDSLPRKD